MRVLFDFKSLAEHVGGAVPERVLALGRVEVEELQRVYGVAFPDSKQMKEYQFRMEEAAKRDHRRIGISQDLFRFNELMATLEAMPTSTAYYG